MATKVTVYNFTCEIPGHIVAPRYMAGTLEAIGSLANCTPIMASARIVDAKLLERSISSRSRTPASTRATRPRASPKRPAAPPTKFRPTRAEPYRSRAGSPGLLREPATASR
jgi:hypothetical protein